ncbi:hypothetical protein DWX70_07530 [Bacteroides ovatus]|uniref:Uncharacterized protein n=3 Tax=Bacteroides ovatus TaxID=28116 RepID=A0A395W4C3_BACOV|nr:hypothetical protein DWX70_07530 [Bacteroides ovatus]
MKKGRQDRIAETLTRRLPGEEIVKLLPFTRKLLIHRGNREKVKGELKRWEINIQWEKLFDSVRNWQIVHSLWTNWILSFSHQT